MAKLTGNSKGPWSLDLYFSYYGEIHHKHWSNLEKKVFIPVLLQMCFSLVPLAMVSVGRLTGEHVRNENTSVSLRKTGSGRCWGLGCQFGFAIGLTGVL